MNQDQQPTNPHVCNKCGQHLDNHGMNCAVEPDQQPTPRTDAETFDVDVFGDARVKRHNYPDGMGNYVDADFARTLERELQSLQSERDKLREALLGTMQLIKGQFSSQLEVDGILDAAREAFNHSKSQCPQCQSEDVDRCHHNGTFAAPECDYWRCNECEHQWGHE